MLFGSLCRSDLGAGRVGLSGRSGGGESVFDLFGVFGVLGLLVLIGGLLCSVLGFGGLIGPGRG